MVAAKEAKIAESTQLLAQCGDMADPHPAAVDEVQDFGGEPVTQHVRCDHPVVLGEY